MITNNIYNKIISIDSFWISSSNMENENYIDYAQKYYNIAKKIKEQLHIQFVEDNNYRINNYDTMDIDYKNYMIINNLVDLSNINVITYNNCNLLPDGLHFGRLGYINWVNTFVNNIDFNCNYLFDKKIYIISDSTIDYAPYNLPDDVQNEIILERHNILIQKLVSIGFRRENIIIDAIGGTGYISSGCDDYEKTFKKLYDIQINYKKMINYFTNNFDINGKINDKYFNDAINIIYNTFGLDNNLFLCRLMKFYLNNSNDKIDYLISLGFGNDIGNIKQLESDKLIDYKTLLFMTNLFCSFAKIKLIN
jgi:hypothetical protein